jgi:hypothetical protein
MVIGFYEVKAILVIANPGYYEPILLVPFSSL